MVIFDQRARGGRERLSLRRSSDPDRRICGSIGWIRWMLLMKDESSVAPYLPCTAPSNVAVSLPPGHSIDGRSQFHLKWRSFTVILYCFSPPLPLPPLSTRPPTHPPSSENPLSKVASLWMLQFDLFGSIDHRYLIEFGRGEASGSEGAGGRGGEGGKGGGQRRNPWLNPNPIKTLNDRSKPTNSLFVCLFIISSYFQNPSSFYSSSNQIPFKFKPVVCCWIKLLDSITIQLQHKIKSKINSSLQAIENKSIRQDAVCYRLSVGRRWFDDICKWNGGAGDNTSRTSPPLPLSPSMK